MAGLEQNAVLIGEPDGHSPGGRARGKPPAPGAAAGARPIVLRGRAVGGGALPHLCTPLVGRTREDVLAELAVVLPKRPDLIEWRVDYFEGVGNTALAIDVAGGIREAAAGIPLIFTCRSMLEGGHRIALDESDVVKLYVAACASGCTDLIDYEMSNAAENIARLRRASRANDVAMILSYHDFDATPAISAIVAKFAHAHRLYADVAKVAVMPRTPRDVLTLLGATLRASESCAIPLIGLSMGEMGLLSRTFGWAYGSALTFAVGKGSSAPGQIPIEDLRAVLAMLRRAPSGA